MVPAVISGWRSWKPVASPTVQPAAVGSTTSTSGRTACTSTCASRRTGCAAWCWSGCVPTAARNSWPLWTATARTRSPGSICCGTCARGMRAPNWLSVMARSASGRRSGRSLPARASSVAGCTRTRTCWRRCRSACMGEAKRTLHAVSGAATRAEALDAARAFGEQVAQWPKATAKVSDDLERLLAFHNVPAEHHVHLRTTNPIESTFATVRLRQRVTKGASSRSAGFGDGLQAARLSAATLAAGEHTASRRRRPVRRRLRGRGAPGASGQPGRQLRINSREGRRLISPSGDPQLFTISLLQALQPLADWGSAVPDLLFGSCSGRRKGLERRMCFGAETR